jgi:aryl-alcohol dehydrogenase-like predicted oxidoreductase
MNNRLALGTVQFGLPYGVSCQDANIAVTEADAILDTAWEGGVNTLDTAISYGGCEQVLGEIGVEQWRVISKLPEIPESCRDVISWVKKSVVDSLSRLGVTKLCGLLLHHPQQLLSPQGNELYEGLVSIREQGKVEKIGISVYGPDELDAIWPSYKFDLVQAPFNILDRRLITSGWLARLSQAGTEIHIRSVFLQGLLLIDAISRPEKFNRWQGLWNEWHKWLDNQRLTPLQVCLSFAMSPPEIDRVVIGVDSLKQLQEILVCPKNLVMSPPESLMIDDIELINPSRWISL